MPRHPSPAPRTADGPPDAVEPAGDGAPGRSGGSRRPATPSLADLGFAGVTRRRIAWLGVAIVAAWIVVGFAGQAAEASRATAELAAEREQTAIVAAETEALRREASLVTEERWILQQARAYQLGSRAERPFALAPGAPTLPPDAPGSGATRLGAEVVRLSPLEVWLEVLFGPQD